MDPTVIYLIYFVDVKMTDPAYVQAGKIHKFFVDFIIRDPRSTLLRNEYVMGTLLECDPLTYAIDRVRSEIRMAKNGTQPPQALRNLDAAITRMLKFGPVEIDMFLQRGYIGHIQNLILMYTEIDTALIQYDLPGEPDEENRPYFPSNMFGFT